MRIDVNAFLGRYAFRKVPGGSPSSLLETMDRIGIDRAWLSNLSAILWKDPTEGNSVVYLAAAQQPRFRAVPAVHPGLANWKAVLDEAVKRDAPSVRADPSYYGLDPAGHQMRALAGGCGELGMPLMMAVRLEDGRQRHPHDTAPELGPADVRAIVRADARVRLIVTHADREFIEQVHFGSTPQEAARILWDICWVWGPPEDHLELLFRTVGLERFTFGTGMPLRLPENSVAKMDLLELDPGHRSLVESGNLRAFRTAIGASRPAAPERTDRR